MENKESITLQLHYFLTDNLTHSMNAKIHNECAKQFIQVISILNKYIDEPINIEVFAEQEGGLIDLYKIILENPLVLITLTALITNSVKQLFTSNFSPAISVSENTKNKLNNLLKIKESINAGILSSEEFSYIVENDKDLKKLKSNFFKSAKKEKKIDYIEIEAIKQDNKKLFEGLRIYSSDFDNCISPDEQEIFETEIAAKIYIVAPVLLRGRKDHWKGIYEGRPIEFRVSDKVFLENVYQHIIKFSNGTYIICNMKITKTISSIDDSEKFSINVFEVEGHGDDEKFNTIYKKKNRMILNNFEDKNPTLFSDLIE